MRRRVDRSSLGLGAAALTALLALAGAIGCGDRTVAAPPAGEFSRATFADPPRDAGPIARWWWPGGAVDDDGLRAALEAIADAGYARVEVQPLALGLSPADAAADPRIRTVGDAAFTAHLRAVGQTARALGLGWDLTLGSGWPSGGPSVAPAESEQQLLLASTVLDGPGSFSVAVPRPGEPAWVEISNGVVPTLAPFDEQLELVAALLAPLLDESGKVPVLGAATDVTAEVQNGELAGTAPVGRHALIGVWRNTTQHIVFGGAFPGAATDAHVVDHLGPSGLQAVLRAQGDAWLDAVGDALPETVFVDSFELIGDLPWTPGFAERFARDTGRGTAQLLPFFFRARGENSYVNLLGGDGGPRFASGAAGLSDRAREDYEAVREALFHDSFVAPFAAWGRRRGVRTRLQAHGGFGDVLDDDATAEVPESEGLYGGGSFDFLKLASSAAHTAGRREATSESFVLTNTVGTAFLSQDDLWRLAGRAFAAGITRLVHHGVAYPYTRADGARWYPFRPGGGVLSAGPLPISSEIRPGEAEWAFLPEFNRAQARLGYALTRGEPHAEVAWLHAARQYPQGIYIPTGSPDPEAGESATSLALRRAGYGYDRVSRRALAEASFRDGGARIGAARYRAILVGEDLPPEDPELLEALRRALDAGVPVLLSGRLPERAAGLRDADARDARVRAAASAVDGAAEHVAAPDEIAPALARRGVRPPLSITDGAATLSTLVRDLPDGARIVLLFNEGRTAARWTIHLTRPAERVELLDPETGAISALVPRDGSDLELELPAARARLLLLPAA